MGYLPGRTCQAMNKDARVKFYLHEAKFCICSAWFFVHLPSHWTKERCVEVGVMYAAPSVVFFSFLQKVSGQQILARCIKDFVFGFVAHIHASHSKYLFGMDPKVLAIILLLFFLREKIGKRDFFTAHHFVKKKLQQG